MAEKFVLCYVFTMRINDLGNIGKTGSTSKKAAKSKINSDFGNLLDEAASAEESVTTPEVVSTSPAGMVGSLISIQVESQQQSNREPIAYGSELLDFLEEIKGGMLDGSVSLEKVQKLKTSLKNNRNWIIDEKLSSTLNEIETRAKVEIAKLDREA